jgi:cytochrome c556
MPLPKCPLQFVGRVLGLIALLASLPWFSTAHAQFGRSRPAGPRQRAEPPRSWPQSTAAQFFPDAFAELEGPRPDFSKRPEPVEGDGSSTGDNGPAGGGSWSSFVSGDTLTDEVKMRKIDIDRLIAKKRDFVGGGYLDARDSFASIAASLAVLTVYDGDVRWKEAAPRGRDRFAAVAVECNKGNDQTFAIATQAAEDLQKLISGSRLEGEPSDVGDWSRIAARQPLMKRLQQAEKALAEVSASEAAFAKNIERLLHEAEIVALIGEFIQQPQCDDFDDETYREYASTMRDTAVQAAAAARKGEFATAQSAISTLRKSCDTCHGDYQ